MWRFLLSRATLFASITTATGFRSSPQIAYISSNPNRALTQSFATRRTPIAMAATQYILHYDYVPDILERRAPYREEHLGLAQKLVDDGKCLAGGPVGNPPNVDVPTGALFVFADQASAEQFLKNDPYVQAGLVTKHSIQQWNVVIEKKE